MPNRWVDKETYTTRATVSTDLRTRHAVGELGVNGQSASIVSQLARRYRGCATVRRRRLLTPKKQNAAQPHPRLVHESPTVESDWRIVERVVAESKRRSSHDCCERIGWPLPASPSPMRRDALLVRPFV